jgi:hypothetical protein
MTRQRVGLRLRSRNCTHENGTHPGGGVPFFCERVGVAVPRCVISQVPESEGSPPHEQGPVRGDPGPGAPEGSDYLAALAMPACSARVAALSVASQVKPGSVRPKWPQLSLSVGLRSRPCSGGERCVPVAAALRREVEEVPNRREQVDAALVVLGPHLRMRGIEMPDSAVRISGEDGDARILAAVGIFAAEIVFKSIRTRAEQT